VRTNRIVKALNLGIEQGTLCLSQKDAVFTIKAVNAYKNNQKTIYELLLLTKASELRERIADRGRPHNRYCPFCKAIKKVEDRYLEEMSHETL